MLHTHTLHVITIHTRGLVGTVGLSEGVALVLDCGGVAEHSAWQSTRSTAALTGVWLDGHTQIARFTTVGAACR